MKYLFWLAILVSLWIFFLFIFPLFFVGGCS